MKLILAFWLLLFVVSIPRQSLAQKEIVIDGVKYVQHTVTKSETVFSLCQKYKVTQKEIMQANPGLTAVLQSGSVVKIPVGKVAAVNPVPETPRPISVQAQPQPDEENYYHKVGKKQTIFTIAKQYGITANELIRYNPELTKGLEVGQVLKIPVGASASAGQPSGESTSVANTQEDLSGFTIHPVVSGETLYSLEQRYGLSHDEMLKNNPALQGGLKSGMKLRIPVRQGAPSSVETLAASPTFTKYQVEKGETLFSLAARFGVEVSDLKKANPSLLSRSLESGETILIPQRPEMKNKAVEEPNVVASANEPIVSGDCRPLSGKNLQKYKVGFLLPFNLPNENRGIAGLDKSLLLSRISLNTQVVSTSADTTAVVGGINIDAKTEGFLEFYEGALIAIDSLQQLGMNIELLVFDASNIATINSLLNLDEFRELNLIVGPVYPELQETVAAFAAKNRISMVSPLAATGNFEQNNSCYFKVNPGKEYQIEQTAAYIAGEFADKNFILIEMNGSSNSQEVKIGELSKEKLSGKSGKNLFHVYSFQKQGVSNLKPLLDETGENIFVLPSDNEAQVSLAVTNLNALAENYNIVLMGTPTFTKMKSIQTENYHKIRLRYLSPYFVDYNKPLVKRFVGLYRDTFSSEPTQFSFQGFDVSYYFLSAMYRYGKDFRNCLPDYPMELTQNTFHFRKVSPMGGWLNGGLFITAFERNFDVLNYGTFGGLQSEK
jgi:LysM repeat protein